MESSPHNSLASVSIRTVYERESHRVALLELYWDPGGSLDGKEATAPSREGRVLLLHLISMISYFVGCSFLRVQ